MLVDNEIIKVEHTFTNGFEFGYQQELGRIKAVQDLNKAAQDIKAKISENRKNELERLTHTPKAQKIWKKENDSSKRKLSESEIYAILLKRLPKDKELAKQYQNMEKCNPDLYGGNVL